MASVTVLRALLGASLGLGALDLVWLDLALAPRVVTREAYAARATSAAPAAPPAPDEPEAPEAPATAASDRTVSAAEPPPKPPALAAMPPAPAPVEPPRTQPPAAAAVGPTAGVAAIETPAPAPAPVVTDARVYFASTSAALDGRARVALRRLAATVAADAQLVIEGRADHRGDAGYNEALSRARALAVAAYLRALGVRDAQLRVGFIGEAAPPAGGALWRDRRVDIQITGGSR